MVVWFLLSVFVVMLLSFCYHIDDKLTTSYNKFINMDCLFPVKKIINSRCRMKKSMNKKGVMSQLVTLVLAIVVVAILGGLAGKLVTDVGTGAAAGSTLANATAYGGAAVNTVLSYLGLIAIVGIIGVIIYLLLSSFAPMMGGKSI
jgi:hypothetical protein